MTPIVEIPHFTLELHDDERYALIRVLAPHEEPKLLANLFQRLVEMKPTVNNPQTKPPIGPGRTAAEAILSPPAIPAVPSPTVPADHWIKKKPEAFETIEVPIVKIENKNGSNGPFLKVTWTNQGRGFGYGSVFDTELFPFIQSRLQQRTRLYVVKNGRFTNIVGVRA